MALTECIYEGDFDKCEKVPAGEDGGFLIQPLGGIAIDMAGPARYVLLFSDYLIAKRESTVTGRALETSGGGENRKRINAILPPNSRGRSGAAIVSTELEALARGDCVPHSSPDCSAWVVGFGAAEETPPQCP